MVEAPAYSFNAFHVGLFPWRRDDPDSTLEDVSGGQPLDAVYLSPFTGPGQTVRFAPDTAITQWSQTLLQGDPPWGVSAYPVWPTVSSGAMIAVPGPTHPDLVCLHVTSHQVHYAALVPRICTLPWLRRVLSTSASLDIICLAIPPGLDCLEAGADEVLHWLFRRTPSQVSFRPRPSPFRPRSGTALSGRSTSELLTALMSSYGSRGVRDPASPRYPRALVGAPWPLLLKGNSRSDIQVDGYLPPGWLMIGPILFCNLPGLTVRM